MQIYQDLMLPKHLNNAVQIIILLSTVVYSNQLNAQNNLTAKSQKTTAQRPTLAVKQTSNIVYKDNLSYCNKSAAYTVKLNGRNAIVYYNDLNHLDRSYIAKGYIEKDKIYIKSMSNSKYVCVYAFNTIGQLLVFNYNTKSWDVIERCASSSVNQNALYKSSSVYNSTESQEEPSEGCLIIGYGGNGFGSGRNLFINNRKFLDFPSIDNPNHITGKIVVTIEVDPNGSVKDAYVGRGTTIVDSLLTNKCISAVKKAKVTPSKTAPSIQKGQAVFLFKGI